MGIDVGLIICMDLIYFLGERGSHLAALHFRLSIMHAAAHFDT